MKIKDLLGMGVVDCEARDVGKISDVHFDSSNGQLTTLVISLKKNFISNDNIDVSYDNVKNIGDYVLLNIKVDLDDEVDNDFIDDNPIKNMGD